MSVVLREPNTTTHVLVSKGALEEMIDVCDRCYDSQDQEVHFTTEFIERVKKVGDALNEDGLRVVAVGVKQLGDNVGEFSVIICFCL